MAFDGSHESQVWEWVRFGLVAAHTGKSLNGYRPVGSGSNTYWRVPGLWADHVRWGHSTRSHTQDLGLGMDLIGKHEEPSY